MFQVTSFSPHCVNIFHPPEISVSMDLLFESELLFTWGQSTDPHAFFEQIGRQLPFAQAMIQGYRRTSDNEFNQWQFNLEESKGQNVQGVLYIGLTDEDFAQMDAMEKVPVHMLREKILCTIGGMERMAWVYLRQGALIEK